MESSKKQIVFYGNHPKREVIAYLLTNGNYDIYCDKFLLCTNTTRIQLGFLKMFFEFADIEEIFDF